MSTPAQIIDSGNLNAIGPALRAARVGALLDTGGVRTIREQMSVDSNACTPTHSVKKLLWAEVSGADNGNGEKDPLRNGTFGDLDDSASGYAVPTADGTSILFDVGEVTGSDAMCDAVYLTFDTPAGAIQMNEQVIGL